MTPATLRQFVALRSLDFGDESKVSQKAIKPKNPGNSLGANHAENERINQAIKEGMDIPAPELAKILGISEDCVRMRKSRIRMNEGKRLRGEYRKRGATRTPESEAIDASIKANRHMIDTDLAIMLGITVKAVQLRKWRMGLKQKKA